MTTVRNNIKVFACVILMLAAGVAKAQPMQPTAGTNLRANHKSLTTNHRFSR